MRHGVVLDPDAPDAESRRNARRLDERSAAGIERQLRLAIEWQPFAVAPQRPGARFDRLAAGQRPARIEHRIERTEALFADGDGCGVMIGTAGTATLRPRANPHSG